MEAKVLRGAPGARRKRAGRRQASHVCRAGALASRELPRDVRERVLDALEQRGRVGTAGDVAADAGLELADTKSALTALAEDSEADLAVSSTGEVLYSFPVDSRGKLRRKSLLLRAEPALDYARAAVLYILRAGFGAALIASVLVVYTTILAILSSTSSSRDDDNRDQRPAGMSFSIVRPFPSDLFLFFDPFYSPYVHHILSPALHIRTPLPIHCSLCFPCRRPYAYYERERRMGFLQSVYSFVFGDGDPNADFEEYRWQQVANIIRSNDGVVTAEQLAPYLDPPDDWEPTGARESTYVDESFVLPALLRFGGEAEVDDSGNLLYRFPDLQKTASTAVRHPKSAADDVAAESRWAFSLAPTVCHERIRKLGILCDAQ